MDKATKKTHKQTKRALLEAQASTVLAHKFGHEDMKKCSTDNLMASGVLIQLTGIGGKQLVNPILIRDGLSAETIAAIRNDIKRSSDLNTSISL